MSEVAVDPALPVSRWNGRVLAVANNKGGVKKTSLVANAGGQLASGGFRVLIVALDTQEENLATDLGYIERSDHGRSLAAALISGGDDAAIIQGVRPNLDVVADGPALEGVVRHVYGAIGRGEAEYEALAYGLLHPFLALHAGNYDLVLIDCPPGNKVLVDAALGAARWLVIPTASDAGSIKSMRGTANAFVNATQHNASIQLLGVLLTGSSTQAKVARATARSAIHELFGGDAPLFTHFIRHAEAPAVNARARGVLLHELEKLEGEVRESSPWWKTLRTPDPATQPRRGWTTNSTGLAEDYLRVTQEIVERITAAEGQTR